MYFWSENWILKVESPQKLLEIPHWVFQGRPDGSQKHNKEPNWKWTRHFTSDLNCQDPSIVEVWIIQEKILDHRAYLLGLFSFEWVFQPNQVCQSLSSRRPFLRCQLANWGRPEKTPCLWLLLSLPQTLWEKKSCSNKSHFDWLKFVKIRTNSITFYITIGTSWFDWTDGERAKPTSRNWLDHLRGDVEGMRDGIKVKAKHKWIKYLDFLQ